LPKKKKKKKKKKKNEYEMTIIFVSGVLNKI